MNYEYTKWVDHFENEESGTVQTGTSMDAKHFNHMEEGIRIANAQVVSFCFDDDGYLCYEPAEEAPDYDYYGIDEEEGDDG